MKNPLVRSEDLTIEGFERFRFSLGDGSKHKGTHKLKGNFDPLASFGSPRNQQIIILTALSFSLYFAYSCNPVRCTMHSCVFLI
ncbi:unnamed protein product [Eruca vesicaria subsp. sativa]|uniref:Uncharacterized protein n=1 Tax=Eruca vesicaria subsp. sativa TaxID=29727 RepID=A0ABC8J600_ERUVS|nr:unnamed protein product [Eruca vesicaria subsp. sativa]